ncbi:hypothetical protein DSO57_1033340 [Entomophthora muscae]|uniref:Uncharacterized protein n=1 Tax=Entomophthora muscae TaxID=34485 RepID=A0ACC2S2H9_9FUNG|nr:hypothetical protein DSO57_1033340 [Entomophthora muscae]
MFGLAKSVFTRNAVTGGYLSGFSRAVTPSYSITTQNGSNSINSIFQSAYMQIRTMVYKLKTHKGSAKRFKKTKNGYKRGQAGKNHLNAIMSGERRGRLRGTVQVTNTQAKLLNRMLQN